jgi:hypothetical protein
VTKHLKVNKEIKYDGVSTFGANRQYAYNGFQATTVQQHMYTRHHLQLKFPELQCLMERKGRIHIDFWPIECIEIIFH